MLCLSSERNSRIMVFRIIDFMIDPEGSCRDCKTRSMERVYESHYS